MPPRKAPLPYKIANHAVRLRGGTPDGTTWPWPFHDDHDSPAWKARYAPKALTQTDLFELAEIADAYTAMITHPCRSVAETIHDLRHVYRKERS